MILPRQRGAANDLSPASPTGRPGEVLAGLLVPSRMSVSVIVLGCHADSAHRSELSKCFDGLTALGDANWGGRGQELWGQENLAVDQIKTHSLWTHEAHFGSACR